jgi:hypothetical protein
MLPMAASATTKPNLNPNLYTPNQTRVNVPDERFDWLVEKHQPKSIVHPWLEICDIAGLVKGAAQGAGQSTALTLNPKP